MIKAQLILMQAKKGGIPVPKVLGLSASLVIKAVKVLYFDQLALLLAVIL